MRTQPRIEITELQIPSLLVGRELVNILSVANQLNRCDRDGSPELHPDRVAGSGAEVFSHEEIAQPKLQEDIVGGAVRTALANCIEYGLARVVLRVDHGV